MSVYISISMIYDDNGNEILESSSRGCGCCSRGREVSKEDALKEIDNAIEELQKTRSIIVAERYDEL